MAVGAVTLRGAFVGRTVCGCPPGVWATLLVAMHEAQEREVAVQPCTYCARSLVVRGRCSRGQYQAVMELGVQFPSA